MTFITKKLAKRFLELDRQDVPDPIIVAKFFNPSGSGTWYATEYDAKNKIFFGYVSIFGDHCDEWGSFGLEELESIKGAFGLGIERDLHCGEQRLSEFNVVSLRKEEE